MIRTADLARRGSRPSDFESENRALNSLMEELSCPSGDILQSLASTALRLCGAQSAGISLLEQEDGRSFFRWHAVAGRWAGYIGGTMPRDGSPCGTVLDRNATLLMAHPERHYAIPPEVTPGAAEAMLIPFHLAGVPVGTLWIIAHDENRPFDGEDERLMTSLARFAATAYRVRMVQLALEEQQVTLTDADRRKNEFLATLAHELRNPLAPVRNAVHVLHLKSPAIPELTWARE
ncbi:MAG: GAF domain-containing protein, partial [Candidatus Eisenbacteria bacterium]